MKNAFGINDRFFKEPSIEKWKAALAAGITEAEIAVSDNELARVPLKYNAAAESQYQFLVSAGLNPSSIHLPYGAHADVSGPDDKAAEQAVEIFRQVIDWAGRKGVGIAVLHPSWKPIAPEDRPLRLQRAHKSVKILGDYAASKNVTLAVEDLPGTALGNCADEILFLTNHGKNASVCFDVSHLMREYQRDFMAKAAPYIVTTHFSDYDRQDDRHWFPGDGVIDWKELIGLFEKAGYRGRYLFEIDENCGPEPGRIVTPAALMARFREISGCT